MKHLIDKPLLTLFFLFTAGTLVAQYSLPDNLQKKFVDLPHDSSYVNLLNQEASVSNNPKVARSICLHALQIASNIRYGKGYARALTLMGDSYRDEGIYEFAQNYFLLAAHQYEILGDSTNLEQAYYNIGELYKLLQDYNKALEYLMKSRAFRKIDLHTYALTLYNIGDLYIKLGKPDSAKKYIDESYELAKLQNNKRVIAYNAWSWGTIRLLEKNYDAALKYYLAAETIWEELGEVRSLIQTYLSIIDIYRRTKNFGEAEKYLKKSIALTTQYNLPDLQVNNYAQYAKLDSARGNYARALAHLSIHNAFKDSVHNLFKAEQTARLQTIYETELREQENQQLRSEKEVRESELKSQRATLMAISIVLFIVGILSTFLYRQRKRILIQKEAIEIQATALLKLNEELQELNRNLEERIHERTSQLVLQNQRITEYTFINAHKLRAPVASVLGLINLFHQVSSEEQDEILKYLKTCGEELDGIIREIGRNLEEAFVNENPK